jgi:phage anti-repressor protein
MNELIKITYENDAPGVSGRDLHEFLEVETPYTMWLKRMMEYGFSEGTDFITKMLESTGGRPSEDHRLTIDMAKELCMIQRSPRGKEARQYFLALERAWNTPEQVMARAPETSRPANPRPAPDQQRVDSAKCHHGPKSGLLRRTGRPQPVDQLPRHGEGA